MNELTELALELQEFCQERHWKFCIIGGMALQHWGEPRVTKDVDMTLLTGFGGEEVYVDAWLAAYESRLAQAREFALTNRVLLLRAKNGIGIDIALGALPFESNAIERAKMIEMEPGAHLRICTAEDLVVMKAFADRPQDRLDLRGILVRQGTLNLDWPYILRHLAILADLKDQPELVYELEKLRDQVAATEP